MHDHQYSATSAGLKIDQVRLNIIRQTIITLLIVGAPAVVASLSRIESFGFMPVMGLHAFAYATNWLVFLNLKRLPLSFQTYYLIVLIIMVALGSLVTFGIAGAGLFILASSCILASFLLGKRTGKILLVFSLSVLLALGALFITNGLNISTDLNEYSVMPSSWVLAIFAFAIFVAIIVNGSGSIQEYLQQAVESLTKHETQLQELVNERTAQMEQALGKLDGILDAATQIGIIATDTKGTITLFNSGAEELLGYKAKEVVGIHTPELWHKKEEVETAIKEISKELKQDVDGFEAFVARAKLFQAEEKQWTYIRKDKEERTVSLRVTAIRNSAGEITGFLGCAVDITSTVSVNLALQESELRLRHMVDNVPGITYRCSMDADWTMSYISPAIENLLGYPANDFIDNKIRTYSSIIYPADIDYVDSSVVTALHKRQIFNIEYRVVDKEGDIHWVYERGQGVHDADGQVEWIDGIIVDITDQKRILNDLQKSEARYSSIIENIPNVVMRVSTEGIVEFINRDFSCADKEDILGKNVLTIVSASHSQEVEQALVAVKRAHKRKTVDVALLAKDGSLSWHQVKIGPIIEGERIKGLTLVATNINKRVEKEAYIKHLALHDHLTGLANRRLFEEKVDFYVKHSARSGSQFALLVLDLDRFKPVNDTYGHDFGDKLLQQLATRFNDCMRDSDIVARLGGDEFAIVLTEISPKSKINTICEDVISRINTPFNINGIEVSVGVSIGIALFPHDAKDALEIVKKADKALYDAKNSGRNQFKFYQELKSRETNE